MYQVQVCRARVFRAEGSGFQTPPSSAETEHPVQLSGAVKGREIVGTANMSIIDKDLGHGVLPIGTLKHLVTPAGAGIDIDLDEFDTLLGQEMLRAAAERTKHAGVDFDLCHGGDPSVGNLYCA
ncbi:MAG: hypothetical protein ACJAVZ_004755 [Afipia broomeae]